MTSTQRIIHLKERDINIELEACIAGHKQVQAGHVLLAGETVNVSEIWSQRPLLTILHFNHKGSVNDFNAISVSSVHP